MTDNVTLPGDASVIATDDVGGVQFQRVKLDLGGDGASAPVVGALPVALDAASLTALENVTVAGTVALDATALAALAAAATPATQAVSGTVALDAPTLSALENIAVTGPVTDTQMRASPVPVSISSTVDVEVKNDSGNPLSVQLSALNYPSSTANSSTAQLAVGASFIGAIETIQNLQAAQVEVVCDQMYTVSINQYIDATGTQKVSTDTFMRMANTTVSENITLPGNYFNIVVTNQGSATTTTFRLDTTFGIMDTQPRALTNRGNFPVAVQEGAGQVYQVLPDVAAAAIPNEYSFSIAGTDIVVPEKRSNGSVYTSLVQDMLTEDKVSSISVKRMFTLPHRVYVEASVSQRVAGDYQAVEAVDITAAPLSAPSAFTVSSIQQATTTLTLILSTAYTGKVGDWVSVYGVADNRLNYYNAAIATISADKLTLTITTADEAAIPSLSVGPFVAAGQFMIQNDQMGLSQGGYAMRFSGTTATSAALLSRFDANTVAAFGTVGAAQLSTIGTTAPVYTAGATGQVELKPTNRYMMEGRPEAIVWHDKAIDSAAVTYTARAARTNIKPANQGAYSLRFRAVTPKSMPRPVAKVVSIAKTGTTTATVVTDVAHGLSTSSYVTIKGVRDTTNFPSLTTATVVASIVSSTSFTIVIGGAVTATSFGGSVHLTNGQKDQPGIIASYGSTVARDAAGRVTFVGSATFAGLINVGDYVTLYGVRDTVVGADLGFDGIYNVNTISTTTLVLDLVVDYTGTTRSPTGSVVTTTNCGGTVIHNTTTRIHDIGLESFNEHEVKIAGQGTSRLDLSVPVAVVNTPAVTVSSGTVNSNQGTAAAISATTGLGGWYTHPAVTVIADVASAAITTTATTATTANNLGNAYQINIPITVVSGTTPTMDVMIQESDDGGTNWTDIYQFNRATATGFLRSPVLPNLGRHVRLVQTIAGTTPSFTRAVNRAIWPSSYVKPTRRRFDYALAVNTLSSATSALLSDPCNNLQLVVNMGAITTTAPAIQMQGSEDGTNWFSLGSPLTAVASSTVSMQLVDQSVTFARAIVTTAGVGATLGYVCIKAWS